MAAAGQDRVASGVKRTARALRLRPPLAEDEAAFAAAHLAMAAEGHTFGLGYQPGKPWDGGRGRALQDLGGRWRGHGSRR